MLELDGLLIGRSQSGQLVFFQDSAKVSDTRLVEVLGTLGMEDFDVDPLEGTGSALAGYLQPCAPYSDLAKAVDLALRLGSAAPDVQPEVTGNDFTALDWAPPS
ncbi:hypothetical protein CQ012_07790 [Arthrobacter sp. MYb214]|nr:hypothetical protein CQ012_07790 [Arthrobacter sp. MYb214]